MPTASLIRKLIHTVRNYVSARPLASLDGETRQKLQTEQLSSVLSHSSTATIISTGFALILSIYFAPAFGAAAHVWFGLKVASALPRFLAGHASKAGLWKPSPRALGLFLWSSLAIDGAVWGLAGIWIAIFGHNEQVALVVACLSSVAMLATFALQVQQRAAAAYVLPMLAPLAVSLLFRGDTIGLFAAAGTTMVIIQTVITSLASDRRMTREFIAREQLATALIEVKKQSSVKTLFLGTMSHELRTPLHGILGLTELLKREINDPKLVSQLGLIRSSGAHLLELIGALLDVSRIDTGKLSLHPAPCNLANELTTLSELYTLRAKTKGISFEAKVEVGDPCWVMADATRIRQVLHNLLGNAMKFTKRGVVTLKVVDANGTFLFQVSDTGPGIPAKDVPHIFEAFRQTDATASRPNEGAGLGLTIARELVAAMGGEIDVASTVGVGTRFGLAIALKKLQASEIPHIKASRAEAQRIRSKLHVLLVEDNDVNALIAVAHLEAIGIRVTRVIDGKQAVEATFKADKPDLVLMDCRMPVMDGPTATREIRMVERATNMTPVPVIALTASPADEDRAECFAAGMNGFLAKPFTDKQLIETIQIYVVEVAEDRAKEHPLYELAMSLEDTEPDIFGDGPRTMH